MANDKIDVIVGKEAYEQVAKLDNDLQGLYKTFLQLYDVSKKAGGNPFNLPTKGGTSAAKQGLTELEKAARNLQTTNEKLAISENKIVTELSKKREELRVTNLKTKQAQQENSKLVGAYGNLTAKLARLRREYKDVAIAEGEMSTNAIKLRKEVVALDSKVRSVDASVGQFQRNVGNYPTTFKGAIKSVGNFARSMFGAFGAIEGARMALDFAKESLEVAKQAKGVEFAFNRLGDEGVDAFVRIKKSTRGLLSDLDIKRSLVEFDNFNLSLEESDTLFEFLAVRATQTGKSIDSLKDSLVEGLSKESKLRIDNLGISASELNEELEKTPDFVKAVANIAKREVKEAGNILDDAANDTEKWAAALENVQVKFGKFLNTGNIGLIGYLAQQLNKVADSFDVIDDGITSAETALNLFLRPFRELTEKVPFLNKVFSNTNGIFSKFTSFLSTPALETFGNFLQDVSYRLAGVGGVVNELINRFKNFKNELLDFSTLDFSSPVALFNSVTDKFNNVINESTDFTIAYQKAQIDLALALAESKKEQQQNNEIALKGNNTLEESTKLLKEKKQLIEDTMSLEEYIANKRLDIVDADSVASEFGVSNDIQDISLEDSLDAFARLFGFDPEEMRNIWYDFTQDMNQIGKEATLGGLFEKLSADALKAKEQLEESGKQVKELQKEVASEIVGTVNAIFDNRAQRIDDDIQKNNDYYTNLLDNEQLTEEQRSQLEAERDAKNAALEKKKREEQRKQAIFNKVVSIAEIGINTATAVTKASAQLGAFAAPVVALLIAQGALQAATVAATPIPQYKKGKKASDNYEGIALLNDGGRDEVRVSPDGTIEKITGRNVLSYVGKDDVIYPSEQAFMNDLNNASVMASITNNGRSLSGSHDRTNFERALVGVRQEVKQGIKEGFKGVKMNVNNTIKTSSRDAFIKSQMH